MPLPAASLALPGMAVAYTRGGESAARKIRARGARGEASKKRRVDGAETLVTPAVAHGANILPKQ